MVAQSLRVMQLFQSFSPSILSQAIISQLLNYSLVMSAQDPAMATMTLSSPIAIADTGLSNTDLMLSNHLKK